MVRVAKLEAHDESSHHRRRCHRRIGRVAACAGWPSCDGLRTRTPRPGGIVGGGRSDRPASRGAGARHLLRPVHWPARTPSMRSSIDSRAKAASIPSTTSTARSTSPSMKKAPRACAPVRIGSAKSAQRSRNLLRRRHASLPRCSRPTSSMRCTCRPIAASKIASSRWRTSAPRRKRAPFFAKARAWRRSSRAAAAHRDCDLTMARSKRAT